MTKLDILEGQLKRNKGHSNKKHKSQSLTQTGFVLGCYRCKIIQAIDLEKSKQGPRGHQ